MKYNIHAEHSLCFSRFVIIIFCLLTPSGVSAALPDVKLSVSGVIISFRDSLEEPRFDPLVKESLAFTEFLK